MLFTQRQNCFQITTFPNQLETMKKIIYSITVLILVSCSTTDTMISVPKAKKIENAIVTHGDTLIDNYFWMRLTDAQKEAE